MRFSVRQARSQTASKDLGVAVDPVSDQPVGPPPGPVGARGDRQALLTQDPADRLDRVPQGALLLDERHDQRLRGSSSPAKKIEARRRISLSSSSRRTFAFSSRIWSSSSVVAP